MEMLVPTLALIASLSANAAPAHGAGSAGAPDRPAIRHDPGSSVAFTVRARIIGASARVGAGHGPPRPRMVPRRATVSAADGRAVPALIFDFE